MKRSNKLSYSCDQCGTAYAKWMGQCSQCESWNTIKERISPGGSSSDFESRLHSLSSLEVGQSVEKISTGLDFLDRILGGGMTPAQVILLAGQPGTGKSTLLFQLYSQQKQKKLLYVSAEESAAQVASRFKKKAGQEGIMILTESGVEQIVSCIEKIKPEMVVIDSIQMISSSDLARVKGGMATVREVSEVLVSSAKSLGIPLWIVGHVTKDGEIAGPKTLEHLVDTVLVFSSAEDPHLRILQTHKNRFGVSGEVAVLEMKGPELFESPEGQSLWIEDHDQSLSGCAFAPVVLGSRVYCVEVQALCVNSHFPSPRRSTSGFDFNRLYLLLAVLEKQLKIPFSQQDVYLNVVGGMKVTDPGLDLAVAAALVSAYTEKAISPQKIYCGELGLTGEVRRVGSMSQRLKAAEQMGRKYFVGSSRLKALEGSNCQIIPTRHLKEALQDVISGA